jgi:hypothetical protein
MFSGLSANSKKGTLHSKDNPTPRSLSRKVLKNFSVVNIAQLRAESLGKTQNLKGK